MQRQLERRSGCRGAPWCVFCWAHVALLPWPLSPILPLYGLVGHVAAHHAGQDFHSMAFGVYFVAVDKRSGRARMLYLLLIYYFANVGMHCPMACIASPSVHYENE